MTEVAPTAEPEETPYRYEMQELAVLAVTVYKDRAEVKRTVSVGVKTTGEVEIQIRGLCNACDLDTIRVEGKGKATITEVSSLEKTETKKADPGAIKTVRDQVIDLEKDIRVIETERERITRRKQMFVGLGDQVRNPSDSSKLNMVQNLLSEQGLSGVMNFMVLYSEQLKHCDDELYRMEEDIRKIRELIKALRDKEMETGRHNREVKVIRQTSILLDIKEAGEVFLTVTYIVHGASWYPRYDIRAFSHDRSVQITYFGVITQRTGEDWTDARLSLSTAQPSIGGNIPELPSQIVDFKPEKMMSRSMERNASRKYAEMQYDSVRMGMASDSLSDDSPMTVLTAEVTSGVLSTMYEIPRQSTVPSDKQEHKVVVALLELKSDFEHFAVPKKVSSTYLRAKLTNTSPFLLLSGTSSIFVDNSFMTKSTLPTVSPAEQFEVSLGIDFAVRIDYRPCQKIVATSGVFTKTAATQYKQVTEIKNTHQHDIKIQIEEQLPRSETEKIKVNLIAPSLPKDKEKEKSAAANGPVSQNSKGNIVWRSVIKAGAAVPFILHYSIEKALDSREVQFTDV